MYMLQILHALSMNYAFVRTKMNILGNFSRENYFGASKNLFLEKWHGKFV